MSQRVSQVLSMPDFSPAEMVQLRRRPMGVRLRGGWWSWRCRLRCAAPSRDGLGLASAADAYECAVDHLRRWHEPVQCSLVECRQEHLWWPESGSSRVQVGFQGHRFEWFTLFVERVPGLYAVPAQRRLSEGGMSDAPEA